MLPVEGHKQVVFESENSKRETYFNLTLEDK